MPHYNIQNNDDNHLIMRSHFNNISMLCNIIQDSHSLIERQQRIERTTYTRRENNRNSSYDIFNEASSSENIRESRPHTRNSSTNNVYNSPPSSETVDGDSTSVLFFSLESLFPSNTTTSTTPFGDASLNVVEIDVSNVSLLDSGNITQVCDIFDIKEFQLIEDPVNDICPITRDRFYMNQNVYMTRRCRHIFNKTALNMWLERNNTCPYCRSVIVEPL